MPFDYSTIDLNSILERAYEQSNELQRPGIGKARVSGRVVFDVWMGVGKTFMSLTSALCFKPQVILIITYSKVGLNVWPQQIKEWYPEFSNPEKFQVIRGTAAQRQIQYQNPKALFFGTTAGSFIRDILWLKQHRIRFDVILVDEVDRLGIRNRKSEGFKAIKELVKAIERHFPVKLIILMTGTWTSKGVQQEWPALNILDPKLFSTYWGYVHRYCIVVKGMFGTEIAGPQNMEGHALALSPYVYTVPEKEAAKKLPGLHRSVLPTELPPNLRRAYYSLANELFFERDDGEVESVNTILAAYTKLRQLINCPGTVDPSFGVGPAIEAVADKICEVDVKQWRHNIIFSPFVPSIPLFKDYLADRLKLPLNKILIIKGGMEPEELQVIEETFRSDIDTCIIASLKSSASWNAETCFNVYFPHFSWDQDENKQAEGRSRRTSGTQEFINAYYVQIYGTITEDMIDTLNRKEYNNKLPLAALIRLKDKLRKQIEEAANA